MVFVAEEHIVKTVLLPQGTKGLRLAAELSRHPAEGRKRRGVGGGRRGGAAVGRGFLTAIGINKASAGQVFILELSSCNL